MGVAVIENNGRKHPRQREDNTDKFEMVYHVGSNYPHKLTSRGCDALETSHRMCPRTQHWVQSVRLAINLSLGLGLSSSEILFAKDVSSIGKAWHISFANTGLCQISRADRIPECLKLTRR